MITVLANGCWDILHLGHLEHLIAAQLMGDELIVSITTDGFVNKGPGRPVMPLYDRMMIVGALRCVDRVMATNSAVEAILQVRPNIFVKGIDYSNDDNWGEDVRSACKEVGAELRFTYTPKQGSGDIVNKIKAIP